MRKRKAEVLVDEHNRKTCSEKSAAKKILVKKTVPVKKARTQNEPKRKTLDKRTRKPLVEEPVNRALPKPNPSLMNNSQFQPTLNQMTPRYNIKFISCDSFFNDSKMRISLGASILRRRVGI